MRTAVATYAGSDVDREHRAVVERVFERECLRDRGQHDGRSLPVARPQSPHHAHAVGCVEVECGDDEIGPLDCDARLEAVKRTACGRVGRRVGPAADADGAPRLTQGSGELECPGSVGMFDQHARPARERPLLEVDRDATLRHNTRR